MIALCDGEVGTLDAAGESWEFSPCEATRGRVSFAAAAHGSDVYVVGGFRSSEGSDAVDIYSALLGTWEAGPALCAKRGALGLSAYRFGDFDGVVAVGGATSSDPIAARIGSAELLRKGRRAWELMPSLTAPRSHLGLVECHGKLFAIGGCCAGKSDGEPPIVTAAVDVLDVDAGVWESGPSMSTARSSSTSSSDEGMVVACCDGKILAVGGIVLSSGCLLAEIFDPTVGAWASCPVVSKPSTWPQVFAAPAGRSKVLLLGGSRGCRGCSGSVQLYNVAVGKWERQECFYVTSHREALCSTSVVRGRVFSNLESALEYFRTRGVHYASMLFDRNFQEIRYWGSRRKAILKDFQDWWQQRVSRRPDQTWPAVERPLLAIAAADTKPRSRSLLSSQCVMKALGRMEDMLLRPVAEGASGPAGGSSDENELETPATGNRALCPRGLAKHRRNLYDTQQAEKPGAIRAADCLLAVRLASLAYTDDKPGTIQTLEGGKEAVEFIAGNSVAAALPLTELLRMEGFQVDRIFSHTGILKDLQAVDTQGYIAHNDTDVVLAFRGSTGTMDWLTNFGMGKVPFNPEKDKHRGCAPISTSWVMDSKAVHLPKVHRGFYDSMLTAIWDIDEVLLPQLHDTRPKRIIVCGHSLGGAIAMGALAYLTLKFDFGASPHQLLFTTCGQPRFGDLQFKAMIEGEVRRLRHLDKSKEKATACRLVNDYDGVPRVPPGPLGYKHAIRTVLLTNEGEVLIRPDGWKPAAKRPTSEYVEDHRPLRYMSRLTKGAEAAARRAAAAAAAAGKAAKDQVQAAANGAHTNGG